jgi:hypothetical protein
MPTPRIKEIVDGEPVSPEVREVLWAVYDEVLRDPTNVRQLRESIRRVLMFLSSPEGRTNANCWAVDLFFAIRDEWERDLEHLPSGYQELLSNMGEAVHDTVLRPDTAANLENTPEQLLAQLDRIAAMPNG